MLSVLFACETSQEKARTKLNEMNVAYDEDSFVQKASEGDVQAVKNFLIAGMDPNVRDREGNTAQIMAAKEGHEDIVNILIGHGADLEARDDKAGVTALMSAATRGRTEMVQLLLDRGAEINARANDGKTALILAAFLGQADTVKLLIEKGANVNAQDKGGRTALSLAKSFGRRNIVEMLVNAGAVEAGK
jgi:ankyrin repeat protein